MVVDSITTLILTDNLLTSVKEVWKTFPLVLIVVLAQIRQTLTQHIDFLYCTWLTYLLLCAIT